MDQLCRLLLAADAFQAVLLRNYCLAGLAQAFRSLDTHTKREQAVFEAFVDAVAPKVSQSLLCMTHTICKDTLVTFAYLYLCTIHVGLCGTTAENLNL